MLSFGRRVAAFAAACALCTACGVISRPFSSNVGAIDERGSDSGGVITISEPQLYARENLINDRTTELTYLNSLLTPKTGSGIDYSSQNSSTSITRNLSDALVARVAANFGMDSGLALQNQREAAVNEQKANVQLLDAQYRTQAYRDLLAARDEQQKLASEQTRVRTESNSNEQELARITTLLNNTPNDDTAAKAALTKQKTDLEVKKSVLNTQQSQVLARVSALNERVKTLGDNLGIAQNANLEIKDLSAASIPSTNATATLDALNS